MIPLLLIASSVSNLTRSASSVLNLSYFSGFRSIFSFFTSGTSAIITLAVWVQWVQLFSEFKLFGWTAVLFLGHFSKPSAFFSYLFCPGFQALHTQITSTFSALRVLSEKNYKISFFLKFFGFSFL
jgi:hypothetical protein